MITFERFEKLNQQHRWSDDEMQKNYAIALKVEKNYMEKFGSIKEPKLGDMVEFSDGFRVYKHASIVENVYFEDQDKRVCICENGSSHTYSGQNFQTSGGAFLGRDKASLVYVGEDENIVWTWGCHGAGADQGIYLPLKVNRWIIPYDLKEVKRSTVYFLEDGVHIQNSESCMCYAHTFISRKAFEAWAKYTGYEYQMNVDENKAFSPQEVKQRCWTETVPKPQNAKPIKVLANGHIHDGLVVKEEFYITEWWGNFRRQYHKYGTLEYQEELKEYYKYRNNPMGV